VSRAVPETTGPADFPSDAVLIDAVRRGDMAAFRVLYERHVVVARRVAVSLAASGAERDDLVAEAFTQILRMLRSGRGPDEEFRAYLLRTMRNAMINWRRRDVAVSLWADVPDAPVAAYDDPIGTHLHATVAAEAFASLPERWRMVLWRTEIDGESPAQIAPQLGMTANGVAALAYRAREGLRQAYLDQHLPTVETGGRGNCRTVVELLPGWVRHGLTTRRMRRVATHLDHCPRCRGLATDLSRLNHELPAVLAPILLGAPFALAHLATTASGVTTASSGAILASTASTGASLSAVSAPAVSWLASAKVVIAGAVIVTTTAVGTVASDPAPAPGSGPNSEIAAAAPPSHPPAHGPAASSTTPPREVTVEPSPEQKASKKAVKHAVKQPKKTGKTAKADAKAKKKAKKEAQKATKKPVKSAKGSK